MKANLQRKIERFVGQNIDSFHKNRLVKIKKLKLKEVLKKKNPYLFKAKNVSTAAGLVESVLNAFLSSSEEELFGAFLEHLAIYIAQITGDGRKSAANGIDLEIEKNGARYLIAIKSGPNWGNSSQYNDLKLKFRTAVRVLRQSRGVGEIRPVLGMCYGKLKTKYTGEYYKIAGQNFWYFISGDKNLYVDLIEPLGHEAKKHDENYREEKDRTYNKFTREFANDFCQSSGEIDWAKLVQFNCGNLGVNSLP